MVIIYTNNIRTKVANLYDLHLPNVIRFTSKCALSITDEQLITCIRKLFQCP